jgi:hypothetical protein
MASLPPTPREHHAKLQAAEEFNSTPTVESTEQQRSLLSVSIDPPDDAVPAVVADESQSSTQNAGMLLISPLF